MVRPPQMVFTLGSSITTTQGMHFTNCRLFCTWFIWSFDLQICLREDRQRGLCHLFLHSKLQRSNTHLLSPLLRRGSVLQRVLGGQRPWGWLCRDWGQSLHLQLGKRLLSEGEDGRLYVHTPDVNVLFIPGHSRLLVHLGRRRLAIQHKHLFGNLLITWSRNCWKLNTNSLILSPSGSSYDHSKYIRAPSWG